MSDSSETDPLIYRPGNGHRRVTQPQVNHQPHYHKEIVDLVDADLPKYLPRCLITVEPFAFFYFFALVSFTPIYTQYFYKRISEDLGFHPVGNITGAQSGCAEGNSTNSSDYIMQQKVQAQSSVWLMYGNICTLVPAIFVTVFYGAHSDKAGRKPCMLLPCLGSFIRGIFTIIAVNFNWPLWSFLLAFFVDGMFGQYATALMGCFSYIADITTTKNRAFRITITELVLLFSVELSQVSMGYLIQLSSSFVLPCIVVTGCLGIALLYVIFLIPELVVKDPNTRLLDVKHVLRVIQLYIHRPGENLPRRVWKLRLLLLVLFLASMSIVSGSVVDMLYILNYPFCWSSTKIGWFTAIKALIIQAGGFFGLVLLRKLLKMKEATIALIAMTFVFASKFIVAFAQYEYMLYIACCVEMLFLLIIPMLRALMSEQVTHHEQGTLFASISMVETACTLFGGTLFNSIYSATVSWFRGFVYFVIAGFYGLAFIALSVFSCKTREEVPPVVEVEVPDED